MRIASIVTTVLLGSALALTGCAPKDKRVSNYDPKSHLAPPVVEATKTARYELYAEGTPNPLFYITLERGADFGFRNAGGRPVAFAQRLNRSSGKGVFEDVEIPLPGGEHTVYYWMQIAEKKK